MMTLRLHLFSILLAGLVGTSAHAQDDTAFVAAFSGDWFIFDPQYGVGGETCVLSLKQTARAEGAGFQAASKNCAEPLSTIAGWMISKGQLRLFADEPDVAIATLGGNQERITGELPASKRGLIAERAQGDESARDFSAALGLYRCVFKGFSQTCATATELAKPSLTQEGGTYGSVELLVPLNVRDQPRAAAPIVGTLPKGTCLKVNFCSTASDGIWCRARFGDSSGWVHKTVLRKGEWPVMTYRNTCPSAQ